MNCLPLRTDSGLAAGLLLGFTVTFAMTVAGANDKPVPEPRGYRLDDYDTPVPERLAGATTVAGPEVARLMRDEAAVVIDVIPEHRRPRELSGEQFWLPVPHLGIDGALWLPDTGYGLLANITRRYLLDHLESATGGNPAQPIVFYCRTDCWMSWNAAKRALAAGFERVFWYRDGIEDWLFEDLPTAVLQPAPGARLPDD